MTPKRRKIMETVPRGNDRYSVRLMGARPVTGLSSSLRGQTVLIVGEFSSALMKRLSGQAGSIIHFHLPGTVDVIAFEGSGRPPIRDVTDSNLVSGRRPDVILAECFERGGFLKVSPLLTGVIDEFPTVPVHLVEIHHRAPYLSYSTVDRGFVRWK